MKMLITDSVTHIQNASFHFLEMDIVIVKIKNQVSLGLDDYFEGLEILEARKPKRKYRFIYEIGQFSNIKPELRAYAASNSANHFTIADAIIINSLSQCIIANLYIRINKPPKPTKLFKHRQDAINWLKQQN